MNGIDYIREVLVKAERVGKSEDTPEGARYIMLSDTLAKRMVREIDASREAGNKFVERLVLKR